MVIKEIQIETPATREHYKPPEWLKLKRSILSSVGKEAKLLEFSKSADGACIQTHSLHKKKEFLIKLNTYLD